MEETERVLRLLRQVAIDTNAKMSAEIGIPQAAAVTCVKPEGTASQLTGTSSGLHAWHDQFYIRTVRGDKKDAVSQFLADAGVYVEDDAMNPGATNVFYFPIKAPVGALTRHDLPALKHLELWLVYQRAWCEHKPSVTIYVKEDEWAMVGDWVYSHFDEISGISFLPHSEHTYVQAPFQDLTEEEYNQWVEKTPKNIDWSLLSAYETSDQTTGTQELSCTAGSCEVVDIGSAEVSEEIEILV
jgi:ribonucleoside-diphosphate reductase alpha chain